MSDPLHVANTQALVVRDGRYLMIVRSESEDHAPGALSPPGGKVEHGDDETGVLEATLRREVLEETGIAVGAMAYLRSRRFSMDRGTPVVDVAFLCQYESGEARGRSGRGGGSGVAHGERDRGAPEGPVVDPSNSSDGGGAAPETRLVASFPRAELGSTRTMASNLPRSATRKASASD